MAINYPYSLSYYFAQANGAEAVEAADNMSDMQSDPTMIIISVVVAIFMFKLWLDDYRANKTDKPNPGGFPGAFPCPPKAIWVAVIGALILLGLETGGEIALGISAEQSDITWLFLLSMIGAAFIEELIFRGFLVIENKGKALLIGGCIFFSVVFTLLHPFFWDLDMPEDASGWEIWKGALTWDFSLKPWFTSAVLLVSSLWFYAMRLYTPLNPQKSLIPPMAAHLVKNVGVFVIKLAQGHVVGLY